MAKRMLSTSFDDDLLTEFKLACVKNRFNMNEALEMFMKAYIKDSKFVETILTADDPRNQFNEISELRLESEKIVEDMREMREKLAKELSEGQEKKQPE